MLRCPDKEVNRRPTSLTKFTADALRGPRVSIATAIIIIIISQIRISKITWNWLRMQTVMHGGTSEMMKKLLK